MPKFRHPKLSVYYRSVLYLPGESFEVAPGDKPPEGAEPVDGGEKAPVKPVPAPKAAQQRLSDTDVA